MTEHESGMLEKFVQVAGNDVEELAEKQRKCEAILHNHGEQLKNHLALLVDFAKTIELVRQAQLAHQKIFEDLQKAVAEKTGNAETGKPPVEQVHWKPW